MGERQEMQRTAKESVRSTIIIPNYNGIRYIGKCLHSLCEEEARVLVVDNGSTDGSRELVQEQFPEADCICLSENTGFCGAVNVGIRNSKTTYVILLNNDTEVFPGFVKALERAMDADEKIFSASAQMRSLQRPDRIDDAGDEYCAFGWAFARGKDRPLTNYRKPCRIFAACGGASAFRRELLEQIGVLDENHFAYLEDIDLGYRAGIYGYRNVYAPEAVVLHAGSGSSGSRYNKFKIDLTSRNSVYLIRKNMPLLQRLLNLPFLLTGFLVKTLFFARKGFGRDYVKGLWQGVLLSNSAEGRAHRVHFQWKNFPHYVRLQLLLWKNIFVVFLNRIR